MEQKRGEGKKDFKKGGKLGQGVDALEGGSGTSLRTMSQRYISLVSPYHVLLLCIGYSHLFIQAVDLFGKTSAGPLTNVYLKLN